MFEEMEVLETIENNESMEQMDILQEKYEAAIAEGNEGAANFYKEKIKDMESVESEKNLFSESNKNEGQEISFGTLHGEKYWLDEAAKEYAKNGESAYYDKCMKYAGEAHCQK